jgi:hypothetical protein
MLWNDFRNGGAWLQFGLQSNGVQRRPRRTPASTLVQPEPIRPLCPELLMRLGVTTLRGSNPRSSAAGPVWLFPRWGDIALC